MKQAIDWRLTSRVLGADERRRALVSGERRLRGSIAVTTVGLALFTSSS